MGDPIEQDRAADHAGIGAEVLLPQRVAEHDHAVLARLVLLSMERAAEHRAHLEHVEELRAHCAALDPSRVAGPGQRRIAVEDGCHVRKGARPLFVQAHEVRRGETAVTAPALDERVQCQQPVWFIERERPQKDPVDDAEDRRRQPDAEGERDHSREGETRSARKRPGRVPKILTGLFQHDPAPRGARVLRDERDIAEVAPGRHSRLLVVQASRLALVGFLSQVEVQFFTKVGFFPAPPDPPTQLAKKHGHHGS